MSFRRILDLNHGAARPALKASDIMQVFGNTLLAVEQRNS